MPKKPKIQEGEKTLQQVAQGPLALSGAVNPFWDGQWRVGGTGATLAVSSQPLFGNGTWLNPMGFWGYGSIYSGTYATYRFMLQHPTIRLARAIYTGPTLASTWAYERGTSDEPNDPNDSSDEAGESSKKPDEIDKALAFVRSVFDRLHPNIITEIIRGLDYGWQGFELIWGMRNGKMVIERMKSLLVDQTTILADKKGNFDGLQNGEKELSWSNLKSWIYTYDGESGNLYGRSRLENLRAIPWKDWMDAAQQIQSIGGKVSGRQAYAMCPAGGYTEPSTNTFREFRADAVDAMTAFAQGKSPIMTNLALSAGDPQIMAKLAATSLVSFDVVDWGSTSTAIGSQLDRQRHDEELMFGGYLVPSRVAQEGRHGTNAESQTMTDTALVQSQLFGDDIARQLQPVVDGLVEVNFALPPGSVKIKQSPLADWRRAALRELLVVLLSDKSYLAEFARAVDNDKIIDAQEIPRAKPFDVPAMEAANAAEAEASKAAAMKPAGSNGQSRLSRFGLAPEDDR